MPQSLGQARHTVKLLEMTRVSVHDSWGIFQVVRSCTLVTLENSVTRLRKLFWTYIGGPVLIPMTREGWTGHLKTRSCRPSKHGLPLGNFQNHTVLYPLRPGSSKTASPSYGDSERCHHAGPLYPHGKRSAEIVGIFSFSPLIGVSYRSILINRAIYCQWKLTSAWLCASG